MVVIHSSSLRGDQIPTCISKRSVFRSSSCNIKWWGRDMIVSCFQAPFAALANPNVARNELDITLGG